MWFSLTEVILLQNVGDRQILGDVSRNFLLDQFEIELSGKPSVGRRIDRNGELRNELVFIRWLC